LYGGVYNMQKYRDIVEIYDNILDISHNDIVGLKEKISEIATSKFRYLDDLDKNFKVISLVCKSPNAIVYFPERDYKFNMKTSSTLLFYEKIKYQVLEGEVIDYLFEINPKPIFGIGENEYQVTSVVRDIYKIKVRANSEEEAKITANNIDLCDWNHLDIDRDLPEIKLMKYSRWGNLIVDKIF
jgi:hypothetical protein